MKGTALRGMLAALALGAVAGIPPSGADPTVTLPPMTSSGGGPIIGGGNSAGIAQQLFSFGTPNVQEADGSDAAQFITAAAGSANPQLAAPFSLMRRALACQTNNAGFGARAYRRSDGQWGGAMVVAAKSATPNVDALAGCAKTNWRRATAGTQGSLCNSGWSTPNTYESRRGETYYILLAGTADDFCTTLNGKFKDNSNGWPF
ncbi:hypothetical protein [Mycobacterium nebraskense]|uniref:Secreted protein n=1 Tax=Mycobacterium nebraskense TaxID=244292 RepID=A0A0F5NHD5_9MYCO|nr:hypothetical protein [Mycobacterium nebraskense]KKC06476.1 hypothetical protein WU83_02740 [Mycobacterium nebraskense]KLO42130.1 hypothetical protein ABW17_12780 [Mycobacterium nebraskense]MBI2694645.1 hypothetical protein [Mycobacterium nebraskense]MCV7117512.1 hypothetical protein [Mycobacterium nebraskense]ORW17567.1 hypothetical protein AWC17_12125 [Mycobacterium nebraskense]